MEAVVETGDSRAGVQPAEGGPAKVGLVHDTLRRARTQPTLFEKVSDEYAGLQDAHGGRAWPHLVVQPQLPAALGQPGQYRHVRAGLVLAFAELGYFRQRDLRFRLLPVPLLRRTQQWQQGHRQPRVAHAERRVARLPEQVFADHLHPHAARRDVRGGGWPVLLLQFRQQRVHGRPATEFREQHLLRRMARPPTRRPAPAATFSSMPPKTCSFSPAGKASMSRTRPSDRPMDS